ncbi:single-stranded-DNA-specific exonuclease RecJ [Rhodobium gokarnense]|uniref:Single-stranded-DNA-specific exonuclease RecJ n=1 Tax=Rhodobium gokarnense TaxID=364296 RepID=A0ABT3HHP7_9HYPH|nr:single-stranded-DNA-specific exonuclease RecJ [Rhodobium gokarnense]MCW2309922.1 single-stranded-DNA-specific exonuclease [Rhodobium gokarnense]
MLQPTGFCDDPETRAVLGVTRSVSGRVWRERLDAPAALAAETIAQRHGLPDIIARVIAARGVAPDAAEGFLEPRLKTLMCDPSVLTDMDAAAARIADAVMAGTQIAVFADYDVDGATSSALLARFLRSLGADPLIRIPDRIAEGYGPNPEAVSEFAEAGAKLLVTVDCGTSPCAAFEEAAKRGLDVVVLDHHQAGLDLPAVSALVNPNRQDDLSGEGHLAAVGVTFLAVVAVNRELRRRGFYARTGTPEPNLISWLDLVALGTVADVVPLKGLNRAFVVQGLDILRRRGNVGLAALADIARLSGPPSPYHLGFLLGPRINAGGRIGDAEMGMRLLTSDDAAEAADIARQLDTLNAERQALEAETLIEADAQVAVVASGGNRQVIVAHGEGWHAGVVGLVASRLKERYRRPAFAIAFSGDTGTGSGRSVSGVDLGAAVRKAAAEGLLVKGGGHAMAAGLTLSKDRLEDFEAFLEEALGEAAMAARENDALSIDGALTAGGATTELCEMLEKAGPFGAGHPQPVFAFPAHRVTYAEPVGNGHVRCTIAGSGGVSLKGIAFRAAEEPLGEALLSARGGALHLAGSIGLDHWRGQKKVQLRLIDAADPLKG